MATLVSDTRSQKEAEKVEIVRKMAYSNNEATYDRQRVSNSGKMDDIQACSWTTGKLWVKTHSFSFPHPGM